MIADLKYAVRSLSKTPGFTLVAVLTMAIAIGACTSLFSVLQAVVLRPLPYPNPATLVSLWGINHQINAQSPTLSWPKFEAFRERKDVFSEISMSAGNGFTLTEGTGEAELVSALHVTANFLPVLGLKPSRGRIFTAEEDTEGGPPVVMISHQLWQNRFGADAEILGRVLHLDGVARTVIGILPEKMPVPFNQVAILVPRPFELPYLEPEIRRRVTLHNAYARLAPGVTLEQANRRLKEMAAQFKAANPAHPDSANDNEVRTLTQQVIGNLGRTFWTLAGAVAAVLLIASANIANLFLVRLSSRQKEIAVRLSLGARRGEIIRQFLAESVVFNLVAGALGVLLGWWSLRGIQMLAGSQIPRANEIALDPGVLIFSVGLALFSALIIALYPALQASRIDVQTVLKDSSRGSGGGMAAKSFRHFLVVAQVALSLGLLICAGLLVVSFHRVQQVELGFDPTGRAYGSVNLPISRYGTPELIREFSRRLDEKLNHAPALERGGAILGLPLIKYGSSLDAAYAVKGRSVPPLQERPRAKLRQATIAYFATLGIQLKTGRLFTVDDRFGGELVAIINESFARKLFPEGNPADQFLLMGVDAATAIRIVGVIKDVKSAGLAEPAPDEIYFHEDQLVLHGRSMSVIAQAKPGMESAAVIAELRRIVAEVDSAVALSSTQTMDDLVSQSIGVQRVTMALLITFAGIAALLAAVGVYSVMAYVVAQRTGEIGVRMALGASEGSIAKMILRDGAIQVGTGLALGLFVAFAASKLLQQALYEVKPFDPLVFGVVTLAFALIAAVGCLIPARRATKVDPLVAFRDN